jgi:hypothetical protein
MSAPDQRNDGLHPRHPGRGKPTSLIAAEAVDGTPEVGGFFIFLPSGATKTIAWRSLQPISPTLDAAKQYTAKIVESLMKANTAEARADVDATNWTSVVAAVQRIILDWNDRIQLRIGAKMAAEPRRSVH